MVERDRLDDHADGAVDRGGGEAGAQQGRGLPGVRGAGDDEPRDVAQHGEAVVVVEVPAEAALVGEPLHPHDERVAVGAAGEELQRGGLAAQLVLGVVQVREVLDLGHRQQARDARPQREAEHGLLVEQGVDHPGGAEPALQTPGHPVHAALAADVLPQQDDAGVGRRGVGERAVDGLREGQRALVLGQLAAVRPAALVVARRQGGTARPPRTASAARGVPAPARRWSAWAAARPRGRPRRRRRAGASTAAAPARG